MNKATFRNRIASSARSGIALLALFVIAAPMFAGPADTSTKSVTASQQKARQNTSEQIRKQLATLTSYGVFDDLNVRIDGSTVTLTGYASRPILKSDAERTVASVEGVRSVVNNIEVLPLSQVDDSIRLKTYLAIYRNPSLKKYSTGSSFMPRLVPLWAAGGVTNNPPVGRHPIHIVVNNGKVTLTGTVDRDMDKQIAGMAANQVSGVFAVNNDLVVANRGAKG